MFPDKLILEFICPHVWRLVFTFRWRGPDIMVKVPAGFVTDLASIPRAFWCLVGHPAGPYGLAAVIHDWLYHTHELSRKLTDDYFLLGMKELGVSYWRRYSMYWSVRAFGRKAWTAGPDRSGTSPNHECGTSPQ
jgi:hypothetical protein